MSIDEQMERLPPERRFRLYTRIARIFDEHGMTEARDSARALAREAVKESPELQAEFGKYLNSLRNVAE